MSASTIAIQQQIYQLRSLAELLASEADRVQGAIVVAPALLCRESMMTIRVLLPKLEAACDALRELEDAELLSRSVRLCEGCKD
jgi:hypothetical protein